MRERQTDRQTDRQRQTDRESENVCVCVCVCVSANRADQNDSRYVFFIFVSSLSHLSLSAGILFRPNSTVTVDRALKTSVYVIACVCVCVCVCVRERERERECVCVCMRAWCVCGVCV